MNQHILAFGEAVQAKNDDELAASFEADILPFLTRLGDAAGEVTGKQ